MSAHLHHMRLRLTSKLVRSCRYVLTQRIQIDKRVSLLGDGSGTTTLYCPLPLRDVYLP